MDKMNCERIHEFIPKMLDGEALDWERDAVSQHTGTCADCAALQAELVEIGLLVRAPVRAAVADADFSSMWMRVERGMDRADRDRRASRRAAAPAFFSGAFVARFASLAAAAAIAALAFLGPVARAPAGLADNHIDVNSVEAGKNDTVTVYSNPDDDVTFIWVDEDEGAKS